jgi:hypothetical protein
MPRNQNEQVPRVMAIAVHPFVTGESHRIALWMPRSNTSAHTLACGASPGTSSSISRLSNWDERRLPFYRRTIPSLPSAGSFSAGLTGSTPRLRPSRFTSRPSWAAKRMPKSHKAIVETRTRWVRRRTNRRPTGNPCRPHSTGAGLEVIVRMLTEYGVERGELQTGRQGLLVRHRRSLAVPTLYSILNKPAG